jgi:integrase
VSLAEARTKAEALWKMHQNGLDPLAEREAAAARTAAEAQDRKARATTFRKVAEDYVRRHEAEWSNQVHRRQWLTTLETYVYPQIGSLPVTAVSTPHIMAALQPIWTQKRETASRIRGRIEAILDDAQAQGLRTGDNPARWRGHLAKLLPRKSRAGDVAHHAALPWQEIGPFMRRLAEVGGIAAFALRYAVLTASRTGEVLGATWGEVDIETALWSIPSARMKARREHRIPLSAPALEILDEMAKLRRSPDPDSPVFPGAEPRRGLSNMALLMTLRRMGRSDVTAHGFRSSFADWAAEATAYPPEVREMALAHTIQNRAEAAYRRGDLFEKRRQLMADWADYCTRPRQVAAADRQIQYRGALSRWHQERQG